MVVDVPEVESAGYPRLHDVLPRARRAKYGYPWWIHYRYHFLIGALVLFLVVFRTYRIIRWYRRRRAASAGAAPAGGS